MVFLAVLKWPERLGARRECTKDGWPTLLKSIHNRTVDSLDNFVDPPLCGPLRSSLTTTRKSLGYSANHESRCDCAKVHLGFLWLQREATSRAAHLRHVLKTNTSRGAKNSVRWHVCQVTFLAPPLPSYVFGASPVKLRFFGASLLFVTFFLKSKSK